MAPHPDVLLDLFWVSFVVRKQSIQLVSRGYNWMVMQLVSRGDNWMVALGRRRSGDVSTHGVENAHVSLVPPSASALSLVGLFFCCPFKSLVSPDVFKNRCSQHACTALQDSTPRGHLCWIGFHSAKGSLRRTFLVG